LNSLATSGATRLATSIICTCLVLSAVLCSDVQAQHQDHSQAVEAIRAARLTQNVAIANRSFDEVVRFWSDDITVRASRGSTLTGIPAYRAALDSDSSIAYARHPEEVQVSDGWPLAWEEGTWTGYRRGTGEELISGRYAAQWLRTGGRWKIRSEIFVAMECSGIACDWPVSR
jgi:ketosteroid isomerase-like protein